MYRMIQNRIEHQSGRDEYWHPLVAKIHTNSRTNICKKELRVTLQFGTYSMVI
jgi:uncharacterized protein YehS (DUF1456 family)